MREGSFPCASAEGSLPPWCGLARLPEGACDFGTSDVLVAVTP